MSDDYTKTFQKVEGDDNPIFVGQQMDVFIDRKEPLEQSDIVSILNISERLSPGGKAMLYLMMCYFNENRWNELPAPQRDNILLQYHQLIQETIEAGQHRAGAMLHPVITATTIRAKDGRVIINDGPFAETKEQLGGYHLMECANLDEAISIASRIPTIPIGGTIEIRPVVQLEN